MGSSWSGGGNGPKVGDSDFGICPSLQKIVLEEQWQDLLIQKTNPHFDLIDVDLSKGEYCNPFRHEYRAATNCEIQSNCPIIILFPHHPVKKKQVLWTCNYKSMAELGGDINDQLPSFKKNTGSVELRGIQMAILIDNRVIRIRGTMGTCYLVWLSEFNEITPNEQRSKVMENVPCLVEMNGERSIRNMVVFSPDAGRNKKKLRSIDLSNLMFEDDITKDIFVREDDPRKRLADKIEKPVLRTTADAMDIVTRSGIERELIQDINGPPAFENYGDSDDDINIIAEGLTMDIVTPRIAKTQILNYSHSSDEEYSGKVPPLELGN
jgi:hypothetical protein